MRPVLVAILNIALIGPALAKPVAPDFGFMLTFGPRAGIPFAAEGGADVGFVLAPHDRRFADGGRTGFLFKPGVKALSLGKARTLSDREELRGTETIYGPIRKNDPVTGDRVDLAIIPSALQLSFSRKGGLGFSFTWIPIPGAPYPWVRGAAQVFVAHPSLAPISKPALDLVDWAGKKLAPWKARYQRLKAGRRSGPARPRGSGARAPSGRTPA